MQESNYSVLIKKLDEFIRKYYKNQLIKGLIYSLASFLAIFLTATILEYYAHFGTATRTFLFYILVTGNIAVLVKMVAIPVLKLNKLGQTLSYAEAAEIIGKHFSNIKDRLLNVLQLKEERTNEFVSVQLIKAGINQKIAELKPIPFVAAINLKENKKYLRYLFFPLLLLVLILIIAPAILKEGTKRLVKHNTHFEYSPFTFKIMNKDLRAIQYEDYTINLTVDGKYVPDKIYLQVGENEYLMSRENTVSYTHLFRNIQKSTTFRFIAEGYSSKEYKLEVLPNPVLLNFNIVLDYPAYTGKKDEIIENTGDLVVPEGTKATWKFNTNNTRLLKMVFNDSSIIAENFESNLFIHSALLLNSIAYSISTQNEHLSSKDSLSYNIGVVPDEYPFVEVEEVKDTLSPKVIYFQGKAKDDYGFKKLMFVYSKKNSLADTKIIQGSSPVALKTGQTQEQFFFVWDFSTIPTSPGDEIEYYFELWDNDGIHGSKSSRSQKNVFRIPSAEELQKKNEEDSKKIKEDISETIKEAQNIQKELETLNKDLYDKKNMGWEEKKKLQDLVNRHKELQKKVESVNKENIRKNTEQSEFKEMSPEMLEKQKKIEELFENVMNEEMKKKIEELEKLLQELNKDKMQEAIEQMKLSSKDIEKEMDRTLELFKQLEVEQKLNDAIEKLDKLAEDQQKLAEKSLEKQPDTDHLKDEQDKLKSDFEEFRKDLDELEKKNSELENPNKMENTESQEKQIQQDMQKGSDELNEKKNKKAAETQKKAAGEMKELSQQLNMMQAQMQQEKQEEDMDALREILENLLQVSFSQEELMKNTSGIRQDDPRYVKQIQQQKKIKDDTKMIEDSLFALSKRVVQIESIINREISSVNMNMDKAIASLVERFTPEAQQRQQMAMTSINNLALLLNEALEQMQKQAQSQSSGNGSCNKPGSSSKPSSQNLKDMQEQLNKQLEEMKKALEKGKQDGGQKGGKKGQGGTMGMSEQLAKMAAQQEYIRRELQKMANELKKEGKGGAGEISKIAEQMEETETDLVNKMISSETLMRQKEILTRLLESEKAQREREMDEKRESNEAKDKNYRNPEDFFEYKRQKEKETELLKTVPPALKPFYKNKVNEYFNNFGQ